MRTHTHTHNNNTAIKRPTSVPCSVEDKQQPECVCVCVFVCVYWLRLMEELTKTMQLLFYWEDEQSGSDFHCPEGFNRAGIQPDTHTHINTHGGSHTHFRAQHTLRILLSDVCYYCQVLIWSVVSNKIAFSFIQTRIPRRLCGFFFFFFI